MKQQIIHPILSLIVAMMLFWPYAVQATNPSKAIQHAGDDHPPVSQPTLFGGELWKRTELYFGSSKPDGSEVSDQEFRTFVDEQITPRFPDGLTILQGYGQFRTSNNVIVKERALVLIVLYPLSMREANGNLEAIREAYKDKFEQESVLRVDSISVISF